MNTIEESSDQIRPVTVLFADIVGSTALGERLPPDQVKLIIGEFVGEMGAGYRSDSPDRALPYLDKSGARALSLGAESQAVQLWQRGLRVARQIRDEEVIKRIDDRLAGHFRRPFVSLLLPDLRGVCRRPAFPARPSH